MSMSTIKDNTDVMSNLALTVSQQLIMYSLQYYKTESDILRSPKNKSNEAKKAWLIRWEKSILGGLNSQGNEKITIIPKDKIRTYVMNELEHVHGNKLWYYLVIL